MAKSPALLGSPRTTAICAPGGSAGGPAVHFKSLALTACSCAATASGVKHATTIMAVRILFMTILGLVPAAAWLVAWIRSASAEAAHKRCEIDPAQHFISGWREIS